MSGTYTLVGSSTYAPHIEDLARRRVMPFLDAGGVQTRSILHLMQEAYLQGLKDAALSAPKDTT